MLQQVTSFFFKGFVVCFEGFGLRVVGCRALGELCLYELGVDAKRFRHVL